MQKPKHWQGEWHDRLTKRRKKRKKCPANYFRFHFLFFFATYLRCLSLLFGKTFVYLFHSRQPGPQRATLSSFPSLASSFLAYCIQAQKAANANQIHLLCISVHLVHSMFSFFSRSLASSAIACIHCARTRTVVILAAHI